MQKTLLSTALLMAFSVNALAVSSIGSINIDGLAAEEAQLGNDKNKTVVIGISHKMGRRFLRRGTCTFSSSGTAIYGVSLIHNQLGLDALVDCFKN